MSSPSIASTNITKSKLVVTRTSECNLIEHN